MNRVFFLLTALLCFNFCAHADTLFYGGDFIANMWHANALPNENDSMVNGDPYGAAVYQNFIIPVGQSWNISGLFSNDIMTVSPPTAYWEIRTGVSEGNGGTVLASGTGADSYHLKGGFGEYTNTVSGLNLKLSAGMYWLTVVPQAPDQQGRSYNTNTFGQNSVGTQISDQQYFNSPFFGDNFTSTGDFGIFPRFSDGVIGTCYSSGIDQSNPCPSSPFSDGVSGTANPEPSTIVMFASGAFAAFGIVRRRRS